MPRFRIAFARLVLELGRANVGMAANCWSRFKQMEEKLGFKSFAYAMRHSYIHHGLTKGKVDPVVMATLAGHADTTMIVKVYGHLLKDTRFMREATKKAIGR